jgi:hypothetical protein
LSLVLFISIGVLIRRDSEKDSAQGPESSPAESGPAIVNRNVAEQPSQKSAPQVANNPNTDSQSTPRKSESPPRLGSPPDSPLLVPNFGEQNRFSAETLIASAAIPDPLPSQLVVEKINSAIRALWSQNELSAPARISDAAWRQRTFQVLLGRDPTDADLARFGRTATHAQREQLVTSLMSSEPYIEEFARRWGTVLTAAFLTDDIDDVSAANRDGMSQYFRRAILEGRRFDDVAKDLLTATGSGQPGTTDYNGAANYLLARVDGKLAQATADTSRLLLGRNIKRKGHA